LKTFFVSLLLFFSPGIFAKNLLDDIRESVVNTPIIKGEFHQIRSLAGVKKKLLSNGHFIIDKSIGILWITEAPFPQVIKITQSELQIKINTQVVMKLDSTSQPAVRYINELLLSIFSGNMGVIEKMFEIKGESSAQGWTLHLTPKKSGPAVIKTINLSGKNSVNTIFLETSSGDLTQINFSKIEHLNELSSDETSKFD
jgi:hypothetical protein